MLHNATLFRFLDGFLASTNAKSLPVQALLRLSPVRQVSHLLQKQFGSHAAVGAIVASEQKRLLLQRYTLRWRALAGSAAAQRNSLGQGQLPRSFLPELPRMVLT